MQEPSSPEQNLQNQYQKKTTLLGLEIQILMSDDFVLFVDVWIREVLKYVERLWNSI